MPPIGVGGVVTAVGLGGVVTTGGVVVEMGVGGGVGVGDVVVPVEPLSCEPKKYG
jgi:hypothetical protein